MRSRRREIERGAKATPARHDKHAFNERRGLASDQCIEKRAFRPLMLQPQDGRRRGADMDTGEVRNRSRWIMRRKSDAVGIANFCDCRHAAIPPAYLTAGISTS